MPSYSEREARDAIASSYSYAEALQRLGRCSSGGASNTLRKWAAIWQISTDHFDPCRRARGRRPGRSRPLEQILVVDSTYHRGHLKERLYEAGLKQRACEFCGQVELWRGRRMALILDHVNGNATDNRLENLRIVCPNCAATLETHCGRKLRLEPRPCQGCGGEYVPKSSAQRYCSRPCAQRRARGRGYRARTDRRKVERPMFLQLQSDLRSMSVVAVGRKYGVTDNSVRKWLQWYEREERRAAA
jgi:hypothetical protein